jgi:hypothetical protein
MCVKNDTGTAQRVKRCLARFVGGWPGGSALGCLNFSAPQFACNHSHDFTLLRISVDTDVSNDVWLNKPVNYEPNEAEPGPAEPPTESIICVDCGGTAHLLTQPPEDNLWLVGDVVAYRCSDCLDRWDLVLMPEGE